MRPKTGDYHEFYSGYIDLTRGEDGLHNLEESTVDLLNLLEGIDESQQNYSYAAGKWTVKQMLRHIIDTDMVFAYRCLSLLRSDGDIILPGFDHEVWAKNSLRGNLEWSELIEQFKLFRRMCALLFKSVDKDSWSKSGEVNGSYTTAESVLFIMAGHCLHHVKILSEKYLLSR